MGKFSSRRVGRILRGSALGSCSILALSSGGHAQDAPAGGIQLPTTEVVGVTPAPGSGVDIDKIPANVPQPLGPADFDHAKAPDLLQAMFQSFPFVSLSNQSGNQFQQNFDYRGFTASPVQGTPQGIAVYQNGVRINESWGDVVNWDFIPEMAIYRMTLQPNNPIFGLNAIGGAISIESATPLELLSQATAPMRNRATRPYCQGSCALEMGLPWSTPELTEVPWASMGGVPRAELLHRLLASPARPSDVING